MLMLSNINAEQCQCQAMPMLSNANDKQCQCYATQIINSDIPVVAKKARFWLKSGGGEGQYWLLGLRLW